VQRQPLLAGGAYADADHSLPQPLYTGILLFFPLHRLTPTSRLQLRVYTAEDVSNELERAKVEYLEAAVRVAGGRRQRAVVVPKLLHWHMRDFADDDASLLEWVHSQLPRSSGPLRRAIREVLGASGGAGGRGAATPAPAAAKMVDVEPYDAEFCYLLPVW
jgi:hypothetical protein